MCSSSICPSVQVQSWTPQAQTACSMAVFQKGLGQDSSKNFLEPGPWASSDKVRRGRALASFDL